MKDQKVKQCGVWMDTKHATILGRENEADGEFIILAKEESAGHESNSNEKTGNNAEKGGLQKFFKNIAAHMQNVDEIHITGTGVAQEQFIKFLASTPQFKNVKAEESTSNKMSDTALIEYITSKMN